MAKFYPALTETLTTFIQRQHLFFVASAPVSGRINSSPKGLDGLRVVSEHEVAYLDLTGSGNETAAHLKENGRLTLMFCSFEGQALILRLYGKGRVVRAGDNDWTHYHAMFKAQLGERQIIVLQIESVQTSCGEGVPLYDYQGERDSLLNWAEKKGEDGIREYQQEKNRISIDGLPTGLPE
jgi:hypothetical protein